MATGVSDEFFETQDKVIGDLVRKFHKKLDDFEIDVKSTMRSAQQGSSMQCFNIAFMFLTQVFPNLSGVVTASGQSRSEEAELLERLRKVEDSQTECNQKQKRLEQSQNDIRKTQSQYEKSQTQLEQKQTQLEKTQTQHEKTQTQFEQKQTQLEKTQTQHEKSQTQLEQKQKELEKTQKRHKRQNKNSQQKQCKDIQGLGTKVNAINKDVKELTKATNQIWGLRKLQKLLRTKTQSPQAAAATTSSAAAASTTASASPCGPIRRLSQRTSFRARTDKDTEIPVIWDVKLLPGGLAVLADCANRCVKLFTIAGQHRHSVKTDCSPRRLAIVDVTATHSWEVAATLEGKKIAMLEVTQHGVTVKRTIPTSRQYRAITAVDPNTFAVGYYSGRGIDLIDHTANVVHQINYVLWPQHMVWSPDQTLVMTDWGDSIAKVHIKDRSHVYKHKVKQVQKPFGITCTQDGSCITTDGVTRTLHLVTSDGVWVRKLWAHPDGADKDDPLFSVCRFQNACLCSTDKGSVFVLDIS